MKHRQRVTKGGKRTSTTGARRKPGRRKGISLHASVGSSPRPSASMEDVLEFYKPIKKPVTLRLDADVLAWFKRDGRRYQTRINAALRRVMEREMKAE
ncbi:MAG TPA: BrnA antitoxin family protein [Candidatus Sulfotelmatobacter sp.]